MGQEKFTPEAKAVLDRASETLKQIDSSINELRSQATGVNAFAASLIVDMLKLNLEAGDTVDFKTGTFSRKTEDGAPSK